MITDEKPADLHHATALCALAATAVRQAIEVRSTPDQCRQLADLLAGGAQFALAIRDVGGVLHAEACILPAEHEKFFDNPLIRLDGPAAVALAPPGSVSIIDRTTMN